MLILISITEILFSLFNVIFFLVFTVLFLLIIIVRTDDIVDKGFTPSYTHIKLK